MRIFLDADELMMKYHFTPGRCRSAAAISMAPRHAASLR
jgi:hypothetical protein